jgi:hypothetical protein
MSEKIQFIRVDFRRFKAFMSFTLHLRHFNILVGPNNAGKSTILAAFRILAAGMRRARQKKPVPLTGPTGQNFGHVVDLRAISIAEENIFYDYDESEPATVRFKLSSRRELTLYFPERGVCYLFANDPDKHIVTPSLFRSRFNCPIGFVPILGPVDHNERLFEKEAARLALFNYQAARNFRNIWFHYPEHFDTFRLLVRETWPGMDIEAPKVDLSHERPVLHMFCPEERIPREIFWSGFGFQVWCQMLTHIVQSSETSLFLIDEPDIYLHSDLQRQLLGLLRNLGPDILIATHSTEIITEAEPDDIVLIDKKRSSARRIKDPGELGRVFTTLGSNLNPILTQLAKTRRAVFVEGKDFQVLGKLARKLNLSDVGNRRTFAVLPVEGFNPERIRTLKRGIETALGVPIAAAAVLDKDYRSRDECAVIKSGCEEFCELVVIHECKEIENLLIVPKALDRAAKRRVTDRGLRTGSDLTYSAQATTALQEFAEGRKSYVGAQYLARRRRFERAQGSSRDEATASQMALEEFEKEWVDEDRRLELVPGKEALTFLNARLQEMYSVSITPSGIIDAMGSGEVPARATDLLKQLAQFVSMQVVMG